MIIQSNNGGIIDTSKCNQIAAGGEGIVYDHPNSPKKVLKVYHTERSKSFESHLKTLNKLSGMFVIPKEIYYTKNGKVAGFEMDYVNFNNYYLLNNLFNKGFCNKHSYDDVFKIKVLDQIRVGIEELHSKSIIVGDLNQYNIFFSSKGEVKFVDVDSFATDSNPHSGVLLDDIRDWTTPAITKNTDIWAFDVLSFWILSYCHPFKWVVPGNTDSIEQRVKASKSYLSNITGRKTPPLYQEPQGNLYDQFKEIFSGRRYYVEFNKVVPKLNVVIPTILASMNLDIREIAKDVLSINASLTRIAVEFKGRWYHYATDVKSQVRKLQMYDKIDELYPSDKGMAYRIGQSFYSSTGVESKFAIPEFFYNRGSLVVVDYGKDQQWNFDLDLNLGGDTLRRNSPLFTKSITHRTCLIQNFGNKKYVNVPNKSTYILFPIPFTTKDAYHYDKYVAIEYINKSKVEYRIQDWNGAGFEVGFLPRFIEVGDMIMVPNNGSIDVYKNNQLLVEFECPMSTQSSALYYTTSGILLLENKTLYLLNTKN